MREIVLDTETTGLDPVSGHRIVEIGCVELIHHVSTGNHFHTYLNPQRDMPPEAERVHGLSATFLSDKPLFKQMADAFLEFIQDAPLVIHNAAFDMKFINAELQTLGYAPISMERTIDTVMMARQKFPGQPASLDALCKRFNISLDARDKHGALVDAQLLADVYLELRGGRQSALGLHASAPEKEQTEKESESEKLHQWDRMFVPLSEEEIELHSQLIKKMKSAIWMPQ